MAVYLGTLGEGRFEPRNLSNESSASSSVNDQVRRHTCFLRRRIDDDVMTVYFGTWREGRCVPSLKMPYNCIIITSSIVATVCLRIAETIMMTGVILIISNVLRVVALCSLR